MRYNLCRCLADYIRANGGATGLAIQFRLFYHIRPGYLGIGVEHDFPVVVCVSSYTAHIIHRRCYGAPAQYFRYSACR